MRFLASLLLRMYRLCGIVQWHIDKSAIDSLCFTNRFFCADLVKNSNWRESSSATLPAGAGAIPAIDSVAVRVTTGSDKITSWPGYHLCNQNSLVLHAKQFFRLPSYLWQDGKPDSVKIRKPGIYSVHVTTYAVTGLPILLRYPFTVA
jgi:hypothetical protein